MTDTASLEFGFGTQIRKSPFFDATVRWGATDFSVYNHMYIPRSFGDPEQNFWNLVNDSIPVTSRLSDRSKSAEKTPHALFSY